MRLIMAVSGDGYLCSGPDDDMSWTGPTDKRLFHSLTSVGGVLAAGSVTFDLMAHLVEARTIHRISRQTCILSKFAARHPDAWLIGGPTVAREAVRARLIDEVHLMRINGVLRGELGGPTIHDGFGWWFLDPPSMTTVHEGDVHHEVYRRA